MVNAQEWLDENYPKEGMCLRENSYEENRQDYGKTREQITELNIVKENLQGSLSLEGFVNLEKFNCSENSLVSLNLINNKKLKNLIVCDNNLTNLNINHLKYLECLNIGDNQLIDLKVNDCINLKELHCFNNFLVGLDLSNNLRLEKLSLSSNSFSNQDLSFLKDLVNLKELWLENYNQGKINQGIYNRFQGSLEPLVQMKELKLLNISNTEINGSLKLLAKLNKLEYLNISDTDIDNGWEYLPKSVKWFYFLIDKKPDSQVKNIYDLFADRQKEIAELKDSLVQGRLIVKFPQELQVYKKHWDSHGFADEERNSWIKAGAKVDDCGFIKWLRDIKKYKPKWITNYKEDYQTLSERFKKYGLCPECNQPNTGEKWCKDCNTPRLKQNFQNWTSQNPEIDKFIQKYQLEATEVNKFIEWIPYEQFTNTEYLAQGGFGRVYKAKWTKGSISHWDVEKKKWAREKDSNKIYRKVVLKSLNNSPTNIDFLKETEKHKIIDDWFNNIVPCYGLSQDPEGNYLMVMQYMPEGNLRDYLSNKNQELSLGDKLAHLVKIAQGLKDIHAKNLVHHDFHSGNILKGIEKTSCLITDLGLCKPANEINKEDKIFGVMPYVAPEVLRGQPYTQASDIYSFGIIAYEILSGLPPYYDKKHDEFLGMQICQGQRPEFQIKIPQLLEDLIERCWEDNPKNRLTAQEIERTLRGWEDEWKKIKSNYLPDDEYETKHEDTEFTKQFQKAEEHNKNLPNEIKFPKYQIHQGAVYTSQLLPTKEISKLLQKSQLILQKNKSSELISKQIIKINKLSEEIKQNSRKKTTSELTNYFLEKSKELTKELEEIITYNPDISEEGKEALKKIKKLKDELKAHNDNLSEENGFFKEQQKEINYLEARVQELTKLIKQKKEKIVNIFIRLLPNKKKELNLIQNLVIAHLEYTKSKKQSLPSVPLRKQRDEIRDKLEVLLGNSLEEEIESSLNDCEELVAWELELEEKFSKKSLLLGEQINENREEKIKKFETIQQKEQKQLQETVFWESYWRNQLSKVEELIEQQNNLQNQSSVEKTGLTTKFKRQLSLETQTKNTQEKTKSLKLDQEHYSEPMEIDYNYQNIHPNFTEELIQNWQSHSFTYFQTQDWINIGLTPQDAEFANFLKNQKNLTPEQTLNHQNLEFLKSEFEQKAQIIHNPPK